MISEAEISENLAGEVKETLPPFLPFRNCVHLSQTEAYGLMQRMLSGDMQPAAIAAVLDYLRKKGETQAEVIGFATAIRDLSKPSELFAQSDEDPVIDTCGTGGDGTHTFNISTATAFVVAGAGARVAKHGNRKISSQCGSADALEQLGVRVDLPSPLVIACMNQIGIGFFYAPLVHPALKHVVEARRSLQGRTVFNLLGPLTNPVQARVHLIGAYSVRAAEILAQAASKLGIERAFVVHGADGLDEITTTTHTTVFQVSGGGVQKGRWSPGDFGVPQSLPEDLTGGDPEANASIIQSVLGGEPGRQRDIVLANAAAALLIAGRTSDLRSATEAASESLDSGAALRKLNELISLTNELYEGL